jgi:hypothetical protein
MNRMAEQAFADHPPRSLLRVAYEDILTDPATQLTAIGEFLGIPAPAKWAQAVGHRLRQPARVNAGPELLSSP